MITEVKMSDNFVKDAVSLLNELKEDTTVPKNIKSKIESVIISLEEKSEVSININKAMNELEEVADDVNLQSFSRTQVWNIVSLLEKA
jgi:uncharacterized protein (UPF0147 family)